MAERKDNKAPATATAKVEPTPQGPQDPMPEPPANSAGVELGNESKNASVKVRPMWPTSEFVVEGVPVINTDGAMLTKTQLDAVQKAADQSGVRLEVEESE